MANLRVALRLVLPLAFLLLLAFSIGCSHGRGRGEAAERGRAEAGARAAEPRRETANATARSGAAEATAPPREIDEDRAIAVDAGAGTPQREASLRVMEEGKGYLIAKRPREAAQRFTRATQIDPTNGFAYYYLGRARIAAGDGRGAVGILQKAESLLGPYPEWREEAARLLASLGAR